VDNQRTGGTAKFRTAAVIFGIWVLGVMVLCSSGCNRAEYGQFPANGDSLFGGVKPVPGDTARLLRNAHYLKLMGRPDMALKELEAARQQDPQNLRVLDTLAQAYEEMGEFTLAQKIYQAALALDDSNQALNNNLCFSYYLTGQWEKAESCFRQALRKNPQNIAARNNLGLLLCRQGRQEEALRLWRDAEGEIAARKKMQQVMVALGPGIPSNYAQHPQAPAPMPVASAPAPKPAPPAAQAREPQKLAAKPAPPALKPYMQIAPPAAARKVAPPPARVKTQAAKTGSASTSPKTIAKPGPKSLAAAQPQTKSQPAPPKQTADTKKKPVPAAAPTPLPKQLKPRLARAAAPVPVASEEPAKPAKMAKATKIRIELLNGSGAKNLARQTRTRISGEGFKVVSIGNYRDFGADQTVIYYRPEAEKAARDLSAKFFPKSRLEIGDKFAKNADLKVLLGKDLLTPKTAAKEPAPLAEKIAALTTSKQAEPKAAAPAARSASSAAPAKTTAPPATAAPPAAPAKVAVPAETHPAYLTAEELGNTAIDIRNGTWAKNLAHQARSMLSQEGFYVSHIGNHWDFGAEQTIIYYHPDAQRVARKLRSQFFPHCRLEQSTRIKGGADVKVLLGKDLLQQADVMAKLSD
jgi:Tfp pilus assembly protein PilF